MVKGGTTYRILSDQVGSVRLVVNADTGAVVQQIDYDAFGVVTQDTNPGFQPFGFAGGLTDPDTGFVRFGARDYDPRVGRWTSKDPIRFDTGEWNSYGYAIGDPVSLVDTNGLWAVSLEGYAGYGGRASLGVSGNGRFFFSLGIGVGLGFGAGFDPTGEPPGAGPCPRGGGPGINLGVAGSAGLGAGPVSAAVEKRLGFGLDGPGQPRGFNDTTLSRSTSLDDWRPQFRASASATVNLTFIGK